MTHDREMDFYSGEKATTHGRDMSFNVHFGKQGMTQGREMNFYSGEQDMTHYRDSNFNVHSGKQDMREVKFHSGEQAMTHDRMRFMRGLCKAYMTSI